MADTTAVTPAHAVPIAKRRGYRPDIEGLRAVAVVAVVLFHAGVPGIGGGYVGVDVFFVISGFLITSQLLNDAAADAGIRVATFYARRVRRLLPAATLTILITLVGAALLQSPVLQPLVRDDARSAAFFYSNLRFIGQARDYFHQGAAPSLFQHFWSLSVEEQFYFVWPTVMIVALGGARGTRRRVFAVLGLIIAASFIACVRLTDTNQPFAFFSLVTRAWELGIGAALAVGARRLAGIPDRFRNALCLGGLALIAAAIVGYDAATTFPGVRALLPAAGSALAIASGVGTMSSLGARVLGFRPFELIGGYSYSLYLFHFPVLGLATLRYPTVGTDWKKAIVVVVIGAVPLTLLSYHLVETPARWHPRLKSTRAALVMGAGCLALTALALAVYLPLSEKDLPTYRPTLQDAALGSLSDGPWFCAEPEECAYGAANADTTVVLFGDSHADMWRAAFYDMARTQGWRVVSMTQAGCPSFVLPREERFPKCPGFRTRSFARIEELQPDLVVFSNHTTGAFQRDRAGWRAAVTKAIAAVPDGIPVAILGQTPIAPRPVPACVALHLRDRRQCEPRPPQKVVNAENRALDELATANRATFVDPIPWICSERRCPVTIGDVLVYVDDDHISPPFAASRAPHLIAVLAPLVTHG